MADQMLDPAIIAERLGKVPAQAVEGDAASDAVRLRDKAQFERNEAEANRRVNWRKLAAENDADAALFDRAAERAEREAALESLVKELVAGAFDHIDEGAPSLYLERALDHAHDMMPGLIADDGEHIVAGPAVVTAFPDAALAPNGPRRMTPRLPKPSPWQACDAGEERRCGEFSLRVQESAMRPGVVMWKVTHGSYVDSLASGYAKSLDAAKRAAESVGGW